MKRTVLEQPAVHVEPSGLVHGAASAHERERERPVRRANRDVHRAGPLHADADRVGLDEIVELVEHLERIAILTRQTECLSERHQVLTSSQFPRKLDVGAGRTHRLEIPLLVVHAGREAIAPHRIEAPVDLPVAAVASDDRDRAA